jgi:hypothetical protein
MAEGNAATTTEAPVTGTSTDAAAMLAENVRLKAEAEKLTQRISGLDSQNQKALKEAKEAKDVLESARKSTAAPKLDTSKPDYFSPNADGEMVFDPEKHTAWLDAKLDERESSKAAESRRLAQEAAIKSGARSIPAALLPKDDPDAVATVEAMIDGLTLTLDPTGSNPEAAAQATAKVRKLLETAATVGAVELKKINDANAVSDHPAGAGGSAGGATSTKPVTLQNLRDATPTDRKKIMTDGVTSALKAMFGGQK